MLLGAEVALVIELPVRRRVVTVAIRRNYKALRNTSAAGASGNQDYRLLPSSAMAATETLNPGTVMLESCYPTGNAVTTHACQ